MAEAAIALKFSFFGFPIRPFPEWVLCGNFPGRKKNKCLLNLDRTSRTLSRKQVEGGSYNGDGWRLVWGLVLVDIVLESGYR